MTTTTPSLETIPGKDLLTRPIQPLGYTIADILPHGVFILAGSPKAGKSWLALDICHAVANGSSLWRHAASQGDVLYLALEDNPARLQERLGKVSSEDDLNASTDIHFATHAKKIGGGLADQLNEFLNVYPRTKLIVIDTLQYIRNTGRFTGTYAGDYHDMDALRDIVTGRNLTLLLVTHTRKTGDADPLNLVSGSTGLAGAVDGIFVLEKHKRCGSMARLTIANRDTAGHQFELRFDSLDCRWHFVREIHDDEDGCDDSNDSLCELLVCLLEENLTWNGTATQLRDALAALDPEFTLSPIALAKSLKHRQGALKHQHGIVCTFTRSNAARFIQLSRETNGAGEAA